MSVRVKSLVVALGSAALVGFTSVGNPVEIMPEADECATCAMAVTNVPLSAELILKDRSVKKFDDIGCMAAFWRQKRLQDAQVQGAWVHGFATKKWLPIEKATFAKSTYPTPMRYGILAFETPQGVKALDAKYKPKVVTWASLVKGQ